MQLHGAVGLRSAIAHLPLHADGRSAPHVRQRDRRQPASAHLRGDESGQYRRSERDRENPQARRDRSADHPEEAQPALFAVARCSVRRSRPTLPTPSMPASRAVSRRPRSTTITGWKIRPIRCSNTSTARSSVSTSRRSRPSTCGCATTTPPTASATPTRWNKVIDKVISPARTTACRLSSRHRRVQGRQDYPGRRDRRRGGLEPRRRQMAAVEGRRRFHRQFVAAGVGAGPIRQLDCSAAHRDRQQARRLRIREDRGVAVSGAGQRPEPGIHNH